MSEKYVYLFVRLEPKGFWQSRPEEDYRKIIEERASEGWRLVTIVTPPSRVYGVVGYYELVFERRASSD